MPQPSEVGRIIEIPRPYARTFYLRPGETFASLHGEGDSVVQFRLVLSSEVPTETAMKVSADWWVSFYSYDPNNPTKITVYDRSEETPDGGHAEGLYSFGENEALLVGNYIRFKYKGGAINPEDGLPATAVLIESREPI